MGDPAGVLATTDGLSLRVRRWTRSGARATVVVVHGFAASCDDGAVVRQVDALHDAGFDVVAYDSRGHGGSEGLCTLGDLERHDVAAAVSGAAVPGRPVIVVGASMGAISVLRFAASAPADLAGVVAISCPAAWRAPRSAQGWAAAALTQTRLGRALASRRMRVRLSPVWSNPEPPTALIGRIAVPVALVHGLNDRFIRPADAIALHRHATPPCRLDLVPGMGHAYDALGVAPVVAAVEWALAAALRRAPAPL
jgi:pimeloyl-ACP methyl ester carboxylesterase